MAIFKLTMDTLTKQWWRDYYEVEAETQEEAIQLILDGEVDCEDSIPLLELVQPDPLCIEITDDKGEILYAKNTEDRKQL